MCSRDGITIGASELMGISWENEVEDTRELEKAGMWNRWRKASGKKREGGRERVREGEEEGERERRERAQSLQLASL